jgi:hypothetical protein
VTGGLLRSVGKGYWSGGSFRSQTGDKRSIPKTNSP